MSAALADPLPLARDYLLQVATGATKPEMYRNCPRQYYYAAVLGLPDEDNVHLAFGEAVHAALEQFNLARRAAAVPAAAELPAWFAAAFDRTRCETEGQYRQLLARGRVLLGRYHGWAAARAEQVLAAETPFEAPYVDGQGRTHTVRGRYDLIVRGPQGVEIVDDKTGKRDGSTLRVNKRRSNSDNDPELANRFEHDPEEYKCQWCPFRQPCAASPVHWY